jgi:hypothetical protein
MSVKLEHANLCVRDIEAMIHFLQTALPEFRVQGEGISNDWTRWVHVGTDDTTLLGSIEGGSCETLDAISGAAGREPSRIRDRRRRGAEQPNEVSRI